MRLSAATEPSDKNTATSNRSELAKEMTPGEIDMAQNLTREMAKPHNLTKALDTYLNHPAVKEKTKRADDSVLPQSVSPSDQYPARPTKKPGRVSCNTRCMNADCYRTYDDGRKLHFQAKQKFNSFNNQFEWDSGSC
jgi:hypothetical protein